MSIDRFLQAAIDNGASDTYLVAGQPPVMRIEGRITALASPPLDEQAVLGFVEEVLHTEEQRKEVFARKEVDVVHTFSALRFRINIHFQQGIPALAIRTIQREIPTPEFLNFPPVLMDAALMNHGLILISGAPSSGTSSVAAAMIELNNLHRNVHIITIEDPPEFIFTPKKGFIEQREVGVDTPSFVSALQAVFREDPDVIFVGEMRDLEATPLLLTAAETGSLVIAILHSPSPVAALHRLVNTFSPRQQSQALEQLASSLILVTARELLPLKDGGRIAAWEILVNTPAVANLIRQNKMAVMPSAMQAGSRDGMVTFEQSKNEIREKGLIA